jgi:Uma2 family endonuclease
VLITPALVHAKVADYLAAGTKLVWVVDPQRRVVTTYRELLSPEIVADAAPDHSISVISARTRGDQRSPDNLHSGPKRR